MRARARLRELLLGVIQERRRVLAASASAAVAAGGGGGGGDADLEAQLEGSTCAVDSLLLLQASEREARRRKRDDPLLSDDFVVDNTVMTLGAGISTSASAIARMLELLAGPEAVAEGAADLVLEELLSRDVPKAVTPGGASGLLGDYPRLESVFFEAFRMMPAAAGGFRKAARDLDFDGHLVPAGSKMIWGPVPAMRSSQLYPEPERFCPFRFLHGDGDGHGREKSDHDSVAGPAPAQPKPEAFGFGRHLCPGRELIKLEMILFFRRFLGEFCYTLVDGQDLSPAALKYTNSPKSGLQLRLALKKGRGVAA